MAQTGRPRSTSPGSAFGGSAQNDSTTHNEPEGIDYDYVEESDSTLCSAVHMFELSRREVKLFEVSHPKIGPTGMAFHDVLDGYNGDYYIGRGHGRAHQSLYPIPEAFGFRHQADPNAGLTRLIGSPMLYQVQRPYTTLGYSSTMAKDLLGVKVSHTQNIMPRWNVSFDVDAIKREGVYTHSGVSSTFFDVTTNYYSRDSRYQIQAGVVRNKQSQEENGGVVNDSTCWNTPNRAGVPVKMYDAANEWRDMTIFVHQSLNTVRQFEWTRPLVEKKEKTLSMDTTWTHGENGDSVMMVQKLSRKIDEVVGYDTMQPHKPQVFNTGVFGLDMQLERHSRNFYDNSP